MNARWKKVLPQLADIDAPGASGFLDQAREVSFPAQTTVFHQGERCSHYMLVLEGGVKVLTRALNGREIVLYRLGAGDSCVLTTACLFGNTRYPAEGVTETATIALTIPVAVFQRALQDSVAFRAFVFQSFAARLASVISLVFVGPQVVRGWVGVVPLLTGLFGFCPAYKLLGFNTCPTK
jgi:CRP/FNR family transcriptional regulator, anaerobic regulatory protein